MTLPPHFFGVVILIAQGCLFVMQLRMHIANKEMIATLQDIATTAQENERGVLANMAGLITAIKEAKSSKLETADA